MPLIDLCKKGHLFEVQQWIAEGKPVNLPFDDPKCRRLLSPLETALDSGFHSLVAVLLDGGAIQESEGWDAPIYRPIRQRRLDLIELLVAHGMDMGTVDMREVFHSWDPVIMEYFIERGANPERDYPLASAFCSRIRTALKIYKKYKDRFPSFQEQLNIALRYHSAEGNLKWVSLMLWAGADPYALGRKSPEEKMEDGHSGWSAMQYAALRGRREVVDLLTKRNFKPDHLEVLEALAWASTDEGVEIIENLLDRGVDLAAHPQEASNALQRHLTRLDWSITFWLSTPETRKNIDNEKAMNGMKAIHILAKHGARWLPNVDDIKMARRTLVKMAPVYSVEFAWIMAHYKACARAALEELFRTNSIVAHLCLESRRIDELIGAMD